MKKILKNILKVIKYCFVVIFCAYILILVVQRVSNNNSSIFGVRIFTIVSGSMVPKYNIGDIIVVKEKNIQDIKVGDDLSYLGTKDDFEGKVVTHSVKEVLKNDYGEISFITEGIANVMPDPEVKKEQIYGTVICKMQILSLLNKAISNKLILFILLFVPLIGYVVFKVASVINDVTDYEEDDKNEE